MNQHQTVISAPPVAQADIDLVRASDLFDAAWYLSEHPDVGLLSIDPVVHYLWVGARIGRNPSPKFDGGAYLKQNTDVAEAGVNPLVHFLRSGRDEGRWAIPTAQELFSVAMPERSDTTRRRKPTLNWVMNPDNVGWAYGNNARMIGAQLPEFEHIIDGHGIHTDVALYFDIKIFKQRGIMAKRNILRVGGPRPIALSYGDDMDRLKADIAVFDGIIVLNQQLYDLFAPLHPEVHLIANALDLSEWRPLDRPRPERAFTVGFAGNLSTTKEAHLKGFRFVEQACEKLGLPLVTFGKGKAQIARENMREKFYGAIDVMVHPVAPGKEGCSNVIMEALAMGVPVITTPHAGFHAERIQNGEGLIYSERDYLKLSEQIERLRKDKKLQKQMRDCAQDVVRRHHDVTETSKLYRRVLTPPDHATKIPNVVFMPFWEPAANFASSRLRCVQPSEVLAGSAAMKPSLRALSPAADVVVVSQLASDETMAFLAAHPDISVIYDVCDRYFEDDRHMGGVHPKTRFFEMAHRADVIVASTVPLKRSIAQLGLNKPVVYLPDGIDYRQHRVPSPSDPKGPVLWYGNPGRGNFESARWMVDHVMQASKRGMRLISRKRSFNHIAKTEDKSFEPYVDICTDWALDTFVGEMRKCSVCITSHAENEQSKSPNRLITAVANGVPTIVTTSPSCAALLDTGGVGWAVVKDQEGLDAALKRLDDPDERADYLYRMQKVIEDRFGDAAIRRAYESLIENFLPRKKRLTAAAPIRAMFVSHNLNVSEGAPTSLLQTVLGLKKAYNVIPIVFAVMEGKLREQYEAAGIEVIVPEVGGKSRLATKIISRSQTEMAMAFREALVVCKTEVVVANTATSLWFASIAENAGIPTLTMIRESSDEHVNFDFGPDAIMAACRVGIKSTHQIVFVSESTRKLWREHHNIPSARLIPNGIDLSHLDTIRNRPKSAVRAELGLPASGLLLLSVGSINTRKSQMDIVEAIAKLPKKQQGRIRLALVGAKPSAYLTKLKERISELGENLAERIHIFPETEQIASWYRAADIFVFASRNESYPRVILEAMSFGLPIVSSAVFGVKEQLIDGESGVLYPAGDVESMAGSIRHLIDRKDVRDAMAQRAAIRFWELVTYWEMVHQYFVQMVNLTSGDSRHGRHLDKKDNSE